MVKNEEQVRFNRVTHWFIAGSHQENASESIEENYSNSPVTFLHRDLSAKVNKRGIFKEIITVGKYWKTFSTTGS